MTVAPLEHPGVPVDPGHPRRIFHPFSREGVYYVHVHHSLAAEPMEIALHGVTSEEQARAAARLLTPQPQTNERFCPLG